MSHEPYTGGAQHARGKNFTVPTGDASLCFDRKSQATGKGGLQQSQAGGEGWLCMLYHQQDGRISGWLGIRLKAYRIFGTRGVCWLQQARP